MADVLIQRTPYQCAIATIAMATGRDYDEVLRVGIETKAFVEGKGCCHEARILEALGFSNRFERGHAVGDFVCRRRGFETSAEFFRQFAWGRRAVMTVPSLNIPDGHHSIYWDGWEVFDPNPPSKQRYTDFGQLLPSEMILFRETMAREMAA